MIKDILVGLDGSVYSDIALQHGIALAKACEATLHGLHVVDIVQVESPLLHDLAGATGAAPQLNLTALMRDNLKFRGQQLLALFRQSCAAEAVVCVEHLATGIVPAEMTRMAHEVDLVLLGRGGLHTRLSKALLGSAVESVVRSGVKPTMVVSQPYAEIRKPLLATDGSRSSMVALSTATAFALQLQLPLSVVYCDSTSSGPHESLEALQVRVRDAGIPCEVAICQGNAHEDLVRYVSEHGHDLLFMGAFGHRRIVEWLLGSTTQYLLRLSPVPLILCHDDPPASPPATQE
jgi:nucleotide-binding universal stress UspA family protein